MRIIQSFFALVISIAFCSSESQAGILHSGEEKIVFSLSKIQKGVTWSDGFSLTETGLITKQLLQDQGQDIWVQTHAFPIGFSWRPPANATFRISFENVLNEFEPQGFIRYSSDKVHWSTWYVLSQTDKKSQDGQKIYEGKIWLPYLANQRYQDLMREWWKTNPIWSSDENEYCEWLVTREPEFFAKQMPFIGYVQVFVERMHVGNALSLKSMTIGYSWSVSGLQSISKDKSRVRKNIEDKWFFEGPDTRRY